MFNTAIHKKSLRIKPENLTKIYQNINNDVKLFNISEDGINITLLNKK